MPFITRKILLTLFLFTNISLSWASLDEVDNSHISLTRSISDLPEELLVKIMQKFALDDLVVFRGVNQAWRRVATDQLNRIKTIGPNLSFQVGFDRSKQESEEEDTDYYNYGYDERYEAELYKNRYAKNIACILKYTVNLENLDVHHLRIGIAEEDEDDVTLSDGKESLYLIPVLQNLCNLQNLNFSGNSLKVGGNNKSIVLDLGSALNNLTKLTYLNLADMYIERAEAEEVLNPLRRMPNLLYLNLNKNKIGCEGAIYLAREILPFLTKLETLGLAYTALTYDEDISYENDCIAEYEYNTSGLKALVKTLTTLQNFQELDVRQLKDDSVKQEGRAIIQKAFPKGGKVKVTL